MNVKNTEFLINLYQGFNKLQASKNTKGFNLKGGKNHELEMELYELLVSMNKKGLSVGSPLIKKQAQKLSERHGNDFCCEYFNFRDGWLHGFKKRFKLSFKAFFLLLRMLPFDFLVKNQQAGFKQQMGVDQFVA